jgi:uncharacterized protein YpmB
VDIIITTTTTTTTTIIIIIIIIIIMQLFSALCFNRFFPQVHYNHSLASEQLKSHTLHKRGHHLDALPLF